MQWAVDTTKKTQMCDHDTKIATSNTYACARVQYKKKKYGPNALFLCIHGWLGASGNEMMAQVYTKITLAATGSNPVDRLLAAGLTPTGNPDLQGWL